MSTTNDIEQYYDDYGSSYEEERREGYYDLINALEFDKIRNAVTEKTALEIGCGTGLILERTAKVAATATGVDLSEGMLEVARRKNLNVLKSSATELDFPDNSFDVVYSFKVLPHVPEIKKALTEIVRVVKPDGRIFVEFYNPYSFKALTNWTMNALRGKKVYNRFDSLARVKTYLPEGWAVKSTRGVRIFAAVGAFYTLPILSTIFKFLDRTFCDSPLRVFGGYMIVEAMRTETS